MTDPERVEALAEWLSWTSGEMTRYSPDAHPDHNRWSWRGDGHAEEFCETFRAQAVALMPLLDEWRAADRAEALREAAEDVPTLTVFGISIAGWLRDQAEVELRAALAAEPDAGERGAS